MQPVVVEDAKHEAPADVIRGIRHAIGHDDDVLRLPVRDRIGNGLLDNRDKISLYAGSVPARVCCRFQGAAGTGTTLIR